MSETTLLLERDEVREVWVTYNELGHPIRAVVLQNVDAIVEANKQALDMAAGKKFGDYNRVASVPLTFLEKTGLQDAINAGDRRFMSKVLNDGDYAGFRTSRGKV